MKFRKWLIAAFVFCLPMIAFAQLVGSDVQLRMRESDQTLPAGHWRLRLNGNIFTIERNTATAGAFGTFSTALNISGTDNVGIGTTTPFVKAEVTGSIGISNEGNTAKNRYIGVMGHVSPYLGGSATWAGMEIETAADAPAGSHDAWLHFITSDSGVVAGARRMTIDKSGNVGINRVSPGAQTDILSSSASTIGLVLDSAASATADLQRWNYNGSQAAFINVGSGQTIFHLVERNLGNDNPGTSIRVLRNNSAGVVGPAAGSITLQQANSLQKTLWVDNSGLLRIHSNQPTGSTGTPSVSDTAGAVVGDQTSSFASKNILREWLDSSSALQTILKTRVVDFTYKSGAYNGEQFTGIVTDWSPTFGKDNNKSFNEINAFGYTVLAFKAMQREIEILQARVTLLERTNR